MNIIFFGSSHFAQPSLRALVAAGYKIGCVVTQSDKPKGRGLSLGATVIKKTAEQLSLKIFQPLDINGCESINFLKNFNADLFVVLAYGQILSEELLLIPKIMAINIHASLLPAFRGAAPINWALLKGEKITGNTLIKITRQMDAGPIILQNKIEILDNDTAVSLEDKLSLGAADLLLEGLKLIETGKYQLLPQDDSVASLAPKLKRRRDGLIDWSKPGREIHNLIRGCYDWPGAFTFYQGKILKIYKTRLIPSISGQVIGSCGQILQVSKDGGIVVATGQDSLAIEELQLEGKKRMGAEDFISGCRISAGECFCKK